MEVGIKDIASKALSLLIASGVITEEEFNNATSDKKEGYSDLFDLIEEKNKQFYSKA